MKLLGWMHRKHRQNSLEPFKEFTSGNPCFYLSGKQSLTNLQQYYPKPSYEYSAHYSWQPQGKVEKHTSELKTKSVEEEEEESSFLICDDHHFDGFLTIGTLGIAEPPTPTFPIMPFEKNIEVTETELKLINDELEKFLDAEAEAEAEEVCNYETSGRSSYASTITLMSTGKQIKGTGDTDHDQEDYNGDMVVSVFPLQEYLFGSSIELMSKTCVEGKKEKSTSLGQLFKLNNTEYEQHSTHKKYHETTKQKNQAKGVHAVHFMKNMLKKLHYSSRNSLPSYSDGTAQVAASSASTKRKLHKVLRMFHKKVHPERSTIEKDFTKSDNYNTSYDGGYDNGNLTLHDEDNRKFSGRVMLENGPTNWNLNYNSPRNSHTITQNRERWIKTDADYLVLEL